MNVRFFAALSLIASQRPTTRLLCFTLARYFEIQLSSHLPGSSHLYLAPGILHLLPAHLKLALPCSELVALRYHSTACLGHLSRSLLVFLTTLFISVRGDLFALQRALLCFLMESWVYLNDESR